MTTDHHGAARIALLALRTLRESPDRPETASYLFLPSRRPVGHQRLVELLSAVAKPACCVALSFKGVIAVGTWAYGRDTEEYAVHQAHAGDAVAAFKRSYGPRDDSAIEVRSTVGTTWQEWRDVERWLSDYDMMFGGYVVDAPDPMAKSGVVAVITFRPPSEGRGIVVL